MELKNIKVSSAFIEPTCPSSYVWSPLFMLFPIFPYITLALWVVIVVVVHFDLALGTLLFMDNKVRVHTHTGFQLPYLSQKQTSLSLQCFARVRNPWMHCQT